MADGQQPVVAQDHRFVLAERGGDAFAFFEVEDDAGVVVEQAVIFEERAGVLGDRVEQPAQRRPRLAVQ